MDTFGEKLKLLRKNLKLTQQEFAEKIGVARSSYALYESDMREPNIETLNRIREVSGHGLFFSLFMDNTYVTDTMFLSSEKITPESIRTKMKVYDKGTQDYFIRKIQTSYNILDQIYKTNPEEAVTEKQLVHLHYLTEFLSVYNDLLNYYLNEDELKSQSARLSHNLFLAKIQVILWDFHEVLDGRKSLSEVVDNDLYLLKTTFEQLAQQKGLK